MKKEIGGLTGDSTNFGKDLAEFDRYKALEKKMGGHLPENMYQQFSTIVAKLNVTFGRDGTSKAYDAWNQAREVRESNKSSRPV